MDSWSAHQIDALQGAGFKPFEQIGGYEGPEPAEDYLWVWQPDELTGTIADTPVWVQNTIVRLDYETQTIELFVLDAGEEWSPRTVEDIPGWRDWVEG